jgi:methylated-DNA-[protein]-cysteine S-methyltransferase
MSHYADKYKSQFGDIYYVIDDVGALIWLYLDPAAHPTIKEKSLESKFDSLTWSKQKCSRVTRQIDEYFNKKRKSFDLKYRLEGTPFQIRVWNELTKIPYGETATYGEIAEQVGKPGAARAVGQANHNNPIMIIVPCHRCIGSDGKVKGAKLAISVREQLLIHEGAFSSGKPAHLI